MLEVAAHSTSLHLLASTAADLLLASTLPLASPLSVLASTASVLLLLLAFTLALALVHFPELPFRITKLLLRLASTPMASVHPELYLRLL